MSKKSRTESSRLGRDEYNTIPIPLRTEDRPTEDELAGLDAAYRPVTVPLG